MPGWPWWPKEWPARPTKVVGRDAVVEDLIGRLEPQRFVTVVGPGGIGKTTAALLAAHDWVAANGGAAVFVDLGDLDLVDTDAQSLLLVCVEDMEPAEARAERRGTCRDRDHECRRDCHPRRKVPDRQDGDDPADRPWRHGTKRECQGRERDEK